MFFFVGFNVRYRFKLYKRRNELRAIAYIEAYNPRANELETTDYYTTLWRLQFS